MRIERIAENLSPNYEHLGKLLDVLKTYDKKLKTRVGERFYNNEKMVADKISNDDFSKLTGPVFLSHKIKVSQVVTDIICDKEKTAAETFGVLKEHCEKPKQGIAHVLTAHRDRNGMGFFESLKSAIYRFFGGKSKSYKEVYGPLQEAITAPPAVRSR